MEDFEQKYVHDLAQLGSVPHDPSTILGGFVTAWSAISTELAAMFLADAVTARMVWLSASTIMCFTVPWPWSARETPEFVPGGQGL